MFYKFKNILAVKTDDLGTTKLLPHRIDLVAGTKPIKQQISFLSLHSPAQKTQLNFILILSLFLIQI